MFRHRETFENDVGSLFMPLNAFITHRSSVRAYRRQTLNLRLPTTSVYKRATEGCAVHRWALGFKQCRFSHIIQALQSDAIHVFSRSPL
jgi:hypothetical protein